MKKTLIFVGAGAAWVLFTALIWANLPVEPIQFPRDPVPLVESHFELLSTGNPQRPSFLSQLERRLENERLFATSA